MSASYPRPSPDEDGSPQLFFDVCAPYGYYELEIKIAGDKIDNHNNSRGIQWQIDAASNEVNKAIALSFHYTDALYAYEN